MSAHNRLLRELRRLGFSDYEARVYLTLATRGALNPTQISDLSGVPRPNVYTVLRKLVRKGFAYKQAIERGPAYLAVSPAQVLESLKKNYEEQLKRVDEVADIFGKGLEEDYLRALSRVSPTETAWLVDGQEKIKTLISRIIGSAEKSISAIITPEFSLFTEDREEFFTLIQRKAQNGVEVILGWKITDESLQKALEMENLHLDTISLYHWSLGEIPLGTYIIDGKECLITFIGKWEPYPIYDLAVWIRNPIYVKPFEYLTERLLTLVAPARERIDELEEANKTNRG